MNFRQPKWLMFSPILPIPQVSLLIVKSCSYQHVGTGQVAFQVLITWSIVIFYRGERREVLVCDMVLLFDDL